MTLERLSVLAAVATTALALTAAAWALRAPASPREVTRLVVGSGEPASVAPRLNADSLTHAAARRDPFRMARTAAGVPYGAADGAAIEPPRPSRPVLVLVGLVGGPEPTALLDGLPGAEGTRALRPGERMGDLVLRHVGADHVVIAAPDTTWTLRLRTTFP